MKLKDFTVSRDSLNDRIFVEYGENSGELEVRYINTGRCYMPTIESIDWNETPENEEEIFDFLEDNIFEVLEQLK